MPNRNDSLNSIAQHVSTLNKELGLMKVDVGKLEINVKWLKKILGYQAALMSGVFIAVVSMAVKYVFLS